MTVWGIGGKWGVSGVLAALPVIAVSWWYHEALVFRRLPAGCFYAAGLLLLLVGVPFLVISARTLRRAFSSEKLCTKGVFAVCRNPIYAAWILFLIPGLLLFFRIPLLLIIPFILYGVLRLILPAEERWLEEQYGPAFLEYKRRVCRIRPGVCALVTLPWTWKIEEE